MLLFSALRLPLDVAASVQAALREAGEAENGPANAGDGAAVAPSPGISSRPSGPPRAGTSPHSSASPHADAPPQADSPSDRGTPPHPGPPDFGTPGPATSGRLRWTDPAGWHITLGFHGEADPAEVTAWLARVLDGRPAVEVRLRGSGTFPGVLWLAAAGEGLDALALAAGAGDDRPYRAHLTLARHPREHPGPARQWAQRLAGFRSRTWTAGEVVLMASGGRPYRTVGRFGLHRA
ncbi:2'-5' RNA ligase family protein [Amycolatopsis jiangsuensis]|uniref:2'-5' RNA ligase n=1 Tax=Amycolatopsis jiangsuensis TaxID=1181879 RepID=A0A840INT5_9PSEU|nr:2'-5' RNA ligase family protein [Amycolatopsis jiangsuensis]MBB4682734.1 2'-5' RNA ligase [Amycolatopsis jiangsuensis]